MIERAMSRHQKKLRKRSYEKSLTQRERWAVLCPRLYPSRSCFLLLPVPLDSVHSVQLKFVPFSNLAELSGDCMAYLSRQADLIFLTVGVYLS